MLTREIGDNIPEADSPSLEWRVLVALVGSDESDE